MCVSLYEDAFKLQSKRKQQLNKLDEEFRDKSMSVKSTKLSTKIVENILNRQIADMFTQLDSDLDGMISANRIEISKLEPRKLEMLTPLLVEMEDLNLELDLENFTEAVKRLSKGLSIPEKDYLLGVETKKKVKASTGGMNDCLFRVSFFFTSNSYSCLTQKPKINPKSIEIAKKRTESVNQNPNYYLNKVGGQTKIVTNLQTKLNNYQSEKERNDIVNCTFKPKINSYLPEVSNYKK